MPKVTRFYRQDSLEGLPDDLREHLDNTYLRAMPNLDVPNPKLVVVFSGGSGVGKSTLARKISHDLQGIVIENDKIKEHILEYDPNISHDELNANTWRYGMELYKRLPDITPNGLLIRDGVIDWYFDRIFPVFEALGYDRFIVGYDVSKEKRIELLKKRGDKPTTTVDRLLLLIDEHRTHVDNFRSHFTPDITLTDDDLFDHEKVVAALRAKIGSLGQQPAEPNL